jgi:hypothetical protein
MSELSLMRLEQKVSHDLVDQTVVMLELASCCSDCMRGSGCTVSHRGN